MAPSAHESPQLRAQLLPPSASSENDEHCFQDSVFESFKNSQPDLQLLVPKQPTVHTTSLASAISTIERFDVSEPDRASRRHDRSRRCPHFQWSHIWTCMRRPRGNQGLWLWTGFIILCCVGHALVAALVRNGKFGLTTIPPQGLTSPKLKALYYLTVLLGLNILAALEVLASDHARQCLLSPTERQFRNGENEGVGYQSWTRLRRVSWPRKGLWLLLILTSLPLHLFSNYLIILTEPVFDAYQVIVSQDFFHGKPFDLSALNITEYKDRPNSPISYGTPWPVAYPAVRELEQRLHDIQHGQLTWNNLSNNGIYDVESCVNKYASGFYTEFRTLIMVTNWTSPLVLDNSALAVGTLPGTYTFNQDSRLVALCPDAWKRQTQGSFTPPSTPYLNTKRSDTSGTSPASSAAATDHDVHTNQDLCFSYRNEGFDADTGVDKAWNASQQVMVPYCLSEPVTQKPELQLSSLVAEILVITLTIKAVAMIIVCLISKGDRVLESDPDGEMSAVQIGTYIGVIAITFIWENVQLGRGQNLLIGGARPSSPSSRSWIVPSIIFQGMLQLALTVREYLAQNMCDRFGLNELWGRNYVKIPWNAAAHFFVTLFFSVAIVDNYGLDSLSAPSSRQSIILLDSAFLQFRASEGGGPSLTAVDRFGAACVFLVLALVPCALIL